MAKKFIRSSEPLIAPNFSQEDVLFYKWLAGFLDGDGYFAFYEKEQQPSLRIKQASWNIHLVELLKKKFGGYLGRASKSEKSNTHEYCLAKKDCLVELLHGVNGYIRATSRTIQYKKLCDFFNIIYIEPKNLSQADDPYFSGMFDADGSIFLDNTDGKNWKLRLSMTSKYNKDIQMYKEIFGGTIASKSDESYYEWRISAETDVLSAHKHFVQSLRSNKLIRFKLVPLLYELRTKRAYEPNSPLFKEWQSLIETWYDNGADIYRKDCKGRPYTQGARDIKAAKNTQEAQDIKAAKRKFKEDLEDVVDKIITNAGKSKT